MPKYPMNDSLLDEENGVQATIQKNRYNNCCINRNVCMCLCTILCIVILITGITCMNVYAIYMEDGSL